jgi:hypothetical protein
MASPIFDKGQYELRGHLPAVTTEAQKTALDLVLARVNGQLDWNAQFLGFNGTSYWGKRIPTVDGSYRWKGLPETVSEKRAIQTGAFGVYNKDQNYGLRPAPFNRSGVGASADLTFDIFEDSGTTKVVPFGQPRELLYEENPRLITGGQYVFNALVDVEASSGATEWLYVVQDLDQGITSVRLLGNGTESEALLVKVTGSEAKPFLFFLASWGDISDWTTQQVLDQFIGVWGNKGNAISSHFLFDSLDVHGFDEEQGLSLDTIFQDLTIVDLLGLVGLVPGPATSRVTDHFNFYVEGCDDFYQPTTSLPQDLEFGVCDTPNYTLTLRQYFDSEPDGIATDPGPENSVPIGCNGVQFLFPPTCFIDNKEYPAVLGQFYLDGGDYDFPVVYTNSVGDGFYDRDPFSVCDGLPEDYERIIEGDDLVIDIGGQPGPILMTDPGVDNEIVLVASGGDYDGYTIVFDGLELETVSFEYDAKTTYGETRFPCVEWVFDPSLDNSTYFPVSDEAAWMGTDDGEYDGEYDTGRGPVAVASQSDIPCLGNLSFVGGFLSFDDGVFDEIIVPNCDFIDLTPPNCEVVDGQLYQPGINPLTPPLSNTECGFECGTVDNGPYFYGQAQDTVALIDGGSLDTCIIYDNTEYDLVQPSPGGGCIAYNNGSYAGGNLPFPIDCVVIDQDNFAGGPYSQPAIDDGLYTTQIIVEILILATESGLELTTEGDDLLGYDPAFITPVTVPSNCTPCSTDSPVPITVDCTLDNGDFESPSPPTTDANDGLYDRNLDPFCVPCQDPNSPVIPCPVEMLRVRLDQLIFSAPQWRMRPSVMNSLAPLRLWKNRVLNVPDPEADDAYINSLVADENSGPENPNSYRHFARLPVEYGRNSKFWTRAEAVLANQSYFSKALPPSSTALPIIDEKPLLYDETYFLDPFTIPDDSTFYNEDYLVSTVRSGIETVEDGFEQAIEVFEEPSGSLPFVSATIVDYDAFAARLLNPDGTRVGNYLKWGLRDKNLTGFLQVDVESFSLRYTESSEPVVSDASTVLVPNIEFPDDPDQASFANYVVCYAYFVADMSASDDPVFDPENWICHRNKAICEPVIDDELIATQDGTLMLTQNFEFIATGTPSALIQNQRLTRSRYIFHEDFVPDCKEFALT